MSVPSTMRAMLLTGHGGPEKLVFDENWPTPAVTSDEVLIRVGACGINNTDIWVREGIKPFMLGCNIWSGKPPKLKKESSE